MRDLAVLLDELDERRQCQRAALGKSLNVDKAKRSIAIAPELLEGGKHRAGRLQQALKRCAGRREAVVPWHRRTHKACGKVRRDMLNSQPGALALILKHKRLLSGLYVD